MTSPMSNESFLQWDAAQVSRFMQSILQAENTEIGEVFLDNNIDGSLLPFITTDHLKEIGINSLRARLVIKKAINELIMSNHQKHPPKSMNDLEHKLHHVNINSNYTTMESLKLSMVLMKEMLKKLNLEMHINGSSSVANLQTQDEIKRLTDNHTRMKNELNQVLKLIKDVKPLPTPTLDPGPSSNLADSPGYLSYLGDTEHHHERGTLSTSDSSDNSHPSPTVSSIQRDSTAVTSPTYSNRFSQGSVLSMGTGKIVSQTVPKYPEPKLSSDFTLQKVNVPSNSNSSFLPSGTTSSGSTVGRLDTLKGDNSSTFRPRLGKTGSSSGATTTLNNPGLVPNIPSSSLSKQSLQSSGPITGNSVPPRPSRQSSSSSGNEPLKQLRASTDDSCLKILQHAMKRHHIPQEDWSKYVLVICYGDKERILKLAEKPVVIFKELKELGKHPAIMLRQLADTKAEQESGLYNDSRIGSDIPGGIL
ncbi:uncharacterized protein SPAPADRAFT_51468 [Spathaspora passalidarum NRRL Y-27907]|uniref:Protein STE50 n=1 Tax=Spathaspora passalidarum (strain NRRL Y-27907 / 11-Y1) TaxID=619300 RepID=G3AQA9_SPAPN|nr:uncharacterized protein SPAPADRAFT_51468 [Spathaspora passalidarum NRRL Y-27907]EGW31456.1 hypothetical protein SPAPADRAFT_51468 [Spathaspora passalidarum NRRL Y-27907]